MTAGDPVKFDETGVVYPSKNRTTDTLRRYGTNKDPRFPMFVLSGRRTETP